ADRAAAEDDSQGRATSRGCSRAIARTSSYRGDPSRGVFKPSGAYMKVCCILPNMSMLLVVIVSGAACDTSVNVGSVPNAPSLGNTTTAPTIPGLPNEKVPTPVNLSNGECPFPKTTHIVAWGSDPNITGGGSPPNMAIVPTGFDQEILYWTIC